MSFFSLPSKRRETKKSASGTRTFVPRLEALESRNLLSTFTVINTSSDPSTSGSLPWGVQQANSTPGLNYIKYNITFSAIQTITINSTLSLTNQVVIDGTSQPGYNGTPLISVQGSGNVPSLFTLGSGSSGSTIQGLDMYDYTENGDGVALTPSTSGDFIQNNWIGFFRDPTTGQVSLNYNLGSLFNNTFGIVVQSSNNVIRNNVIDGNFNGIFVMGASFMAAHEVVPAVNNSISANFIGTDPSGTTAAGYGNQGNGIFIGPNTQGNSIAMNVIAGAGLDGVVLSGATSNFVNQNWIGESTNGQSFPNGNYGVELQAGANDNYVGKNTFGPNGVGSVYVDTNAVGNYIGYTPQPTPSSFSAQIQQLFGYFPLMVEAAQTGNVNAFFQALQSYVTLYVTVELEILNAFQRS